MKKSIFDTCSNTAISKLYKHPELGNFMHYSFIVQNNKIIEWGTNRRVCPAKHFGYNKKCTDVDFVPKRHSELDVYFKARGLLNKTKPFEIINIRLNKKGQLKLSKPCSCCYELLKALGCKNFYYSSAVGFLSIR